MTDTTVRSGNAPFLMPSSGLLRVPGGNVPGKQEWAAVLTYVEGLYRRSIFPPESPFGRRWVNIGPGYCYGPACGHIDLVHQTLNLVGDDPAVARDQMLNLFEVQRADGSLPFVWMGENPARKWLPPRTSMSERLRMSGTYPPLWPAGVEACLRTAPDEELLAKAYPRLVRQIGWFDANRRLPDGGYFYEDVRTRNWESGMDCSVRFEPRPEQTSACVDATSHVCWCRQFAAAWAGRLGVDPTLHHEEAERLKGYIQRNMFCEETNWFHDVWHLRKGHARPMAFEGMWPLVTGAASSAQGAAALAGTVLSPERFNTPHPIPSVAIGDPAFARRMWQGPTWNCMTLWAVEGCLRYGRTDGARELLEKALDGTARQFTRTGTVWEFYDPMGGEPEKLERKPHSQFNIPCRDYLGHNALHAMARLWNGLAGEK